MAYCRFTDGDVYVYESERGIECCACRFEGYNEGAILPRSRVLATPADAVAHLLEHRMAGHDIPQDAIDELQAEANKQAIQQGVATDALQRRNASETGSTPALSGAGEFGVQPQISVSGARKNNLKFFSKPLDAHKALCFN